MRAARATWTAFLLLGSTTIASTAVQAPADVQASAEPKLDPALIPKQKEQLKSHFNKVKIAGITILETPHFFLASTLEENKLRPMTTTLEKLVPVVRSPLGLAPGEVPWKGKLAICYLPEPRDFRTFVREILQQQPERVHYVLDGDTPLLVTSGQAVGAATEAERQQVVLTQVAQAFLKAKSPRAAQLPFWLTSAFGRVCLWRAEGLKSPRYTQYRKQVVQLIRENRLKPSDLFSQELPEHPGVRVLAESFVEFLAFGPEADKFLTLLSSFRPDENGQVSGVAAVLERLGLPLGPLEQQWRDWFQSKKPPAKKGPVSKQG